MGGEIPAAFRSKYLYFEPDFPGLFIANLQEFNLTFLQKSNFLARMLNPKVEALTGALAKTSEYTSVPGLGQTYVFDRLGVVYLSNFTENSSQSWGTSYSSPYNGMSGITGKSTHLPPHLFMHEFFHSSISADHAWNVATIAGCKSRPGQYKFELINQVDGIKIYNKKITKGSNDKAFSEGIVFPFNLTNSTELVKSIDLPPEITEDVFNSNILDNPLKPPFAYTAKNYNYPVQKKAVDVAIEDYNRIATEVAGDALYTSYKGSAFTGEEVLAKYEERRNSFQADLDSMSEYVTGNFGELQGETWISGDEKAYIEFFINDYIKFYTKNFTSKYVFTSGVQDGTTSARFDLAIPRAQDPALPTTATPYCYQVYSGLQSFWGGSYIINNPPAIDTSYGGGKVVNITGNRYATIMDKPFGYPAYVTYYYDAGGATSIVTALNVYNITNEYGDWYMPSIEELEEAHLAGLTFSGILWSSTPHSIPGQMKAFNANTGVVTNSGEGKLQVRLFRKADLLQDDTITTSFVVNPTNDDGTRKGPDVTSNIPFCKLDDDDKPTNEFDPTWYHNFNSYNPAYPPYPDNTKITDMLNEEYCPCLYKAQKYYDNSATPFEYTIMENEGEFPALFRLYEETDIYIQNVKKTGTTAKLMENNITDVLIYIINKYNYNYILPATFSKSTYRSVPNPLLYQYSDTDKTYLEIIPAIGYYGFGYYTPLPNVYNLNLEEAAKYYRFISENTQKIDDNTPAELKLFQSIDFNRVQYPRELRLPVQNVSTSLVGGSGTLGLPVGIESRYKIGSSDENNVIYNPLKQFHDRVYGYGKGGTPLNLYLKYSQYFKDFLGIYNPLSLNHVMVYGAVEMLQDHPNVYSRSEVQRLNYLFNSNNYQHALYRTIAAENSMDEFKDIVAEGAVYTAKDLIIFLNEDAGFFEYLPMEHYIFDVVGPYSSTSSVIVAELGEEGETSVEILRLELLMLNPLDYQITHSRAIAKPASVIGRPPTIAEWEKINETLIQTGKIDLDIENNNATDQYPGRTYYWAKDYADAEEIKAKRVYFQGEKDKREFKIDHGGSKIHTMQYAIGVRMETVRADEVLVGENTRYYIKDSLEMFVKSVKAYDTGDQVGGCMDYVNSINYNPDATYDDGSCVEKVYGCMKTWADNYDDDANTEDGTCFAQICTNVNATGDWGHGYDSAVIDKVNEYMLNYPGNHVLEEAETTVVEMLDIDSDNPACQILLEQRPTILKLVCLSRLSEIDGITCNDTTTITIIEDEFSKDISTYTENPILRELTIKELAGEIGTLGTKNPHVHGIDIFQDTDNSANKIVSHPFPSDEKVFSATEEFREMGIIANTTEAVQLAVLSEYISGKHLSVEDLETLIGETGTEYTYRRKIRLEWERLVYNCIENPIQGDGSGGCILFSYESQDGPNDYKIQGCVLPEIISQTPEDCFNLPLFEGGYLADASILSGDFKIKEGTCPDNIESKYIIGGRLTSSGSGLQIISENSLPMYDSAQFSNISGYDSNLLNTAQIPENLNGDNNNDLGERSSNISSISPVLYMLNPNILYTQNEEFYTGAFVYTVVNSSKQFYIYDVESNVTSSRLYSRNELLTQGAPLTEGERTSKKMNEIVDEINNLTIFG